MIQEAKQRNDSISRQSLEIQQIGALRKLWKNIAYDPSVEQVHKLRTTTRRVEAVFNTLQLEKKRSVRDLLQTLKPVRRAAGDVRDLDVFFAILQRLNDYQGGDSLTRLTDHIEHERARKAKALARFMHKHRRPSLQGLRKQQKRIDKLLLDRSAQRITKIEANSLHSLLHLVSWPELEAGNLHAFRIQVKMLRYILQLSTKSDHDLIKALGGVKNAIGDWHDYLELIRVARRMSLGESSDALLRNLESMTKQKLSHALATANHFKHRYLDVPPRKHVVEVKPDIDRLSFNAKQTA